MRTLEDQAAEVAIERDQQPIRDPGVLEHDFIVRGAKDLSDVLDVMPC